MLIFMCALLSYILSVICVKALFDVFNIFDDGNEVEGAYRCGSGNDRPFAALLWPFVIVVFVIYHTGRLVYLLFYKVFSAVKRRFKRH